VDGADVGLVWLTESRFGAHFFSPLPFSVIRRTVDVGVRTGKGCWGEVGVKKPLFAMVISLPAAYVEFRLLWQILQPIEY